MARLQSARTGGPVYKCSLHMLAAYGWMDRAASSEMAHAINMLPADEWAPHIPTTLWRYALTEKLIDCPRRDPSV